MSEQETAPYAIPPDDNYKETLMAVSVLTTAFAENDGPQRDRPKDRKNYIASLRKRAETYGEFNPIIFTTRIASHRANGEYWPLDGNGSNHWVEQLFGPDYLIPVRLVEGLTLGQENKLFQAIQNRKRVTVNERFRNDSEYDPESPASQMGKAVAAAGFRISSSPKATWAVGSTTAQVVFDRHGAPALTDVLAVIKDLYPPEDWHRTTGAMVKAVAFLLNHSEYGQLDRDRLIRTLRKQSAQAWTDGAAGGHGSESKVVPRIKACW